MNILLSSIESANSVDTVSILIILLMLFLFVLTWGFNRISILRIRRKSEQANDLSMIMKHTLNMSHNQVLRLSISERYGMNMHGHFLPDEGMSFEEREIKITGKKGIVRCRVVVEIKGETFGREVRVLMHKVRDRWYIAGVEEFYDD